MPIINKRAKFSKVVSPYDNKDEIDQKFNFMLQEIKNCPELEGIYLKANGLEERHVPLLLEALKDHEKLLEIDLSYNFSEEPHTHLMTHFITLIQSHLKLNYLNLISCRLKDEEVNQLFNGLSDDEVEIVQIKLNKNELTTRSAEHVFKRKFNVGTIAGLAGNNHINQTDPTMLSELKKIQNYGYSSQTFPQTPPLLQSFQNIKLEESKPEQSLPRMINKLK